MQNASSRIVWVLALLIIIPAAIYLMLGIIDSCQASHFPDMWEWAGNSAEKTSCWQIPPLEIFTPLQ